MIMCCLLLAFILVIIYIAYKIYEYQKGKTFIENISNRYVFITGCDSGFGNGFARLLDKQGVPVIAGCLTEKGGADLKKQTSSRLRVVQIDVTDQTSIRNAVDSVKRILPKSAGKKSPEVRVRKNNNKKTATRSCIRLKRRVTS